MEEKIWNYIDGTCTQAERTEVELLLTSNSAFKNKYEELLLLNNSLKNLETDEPSMRFGQNIMDRINAEIPLTPLKTAIDKRIINGIGFFFISVLVVMLGKLLGNVQWTESNYSFDVLGKIDTGVFFNKQFFTAFMFIDVILALWFVDKFVRSKNVEE